ncbi:hypothetical protein TEA_014729 [Camellia sinensis var. sinensis]|uniref:JmjC domain-containing protein n=1 Tax=Camellia sinensis var. sinensis TaxID=542762 RepID=A0A4S4ELW1_CAMSN|nr:hypothetical protein TEA_014729 [Camellia sinensis var. sinensis]
MTDIAGDFSETLKTPLMDSEGPNILHKISEQGGYAYVGMSALASAGDFRAAEAAREMAWEQLHSGPWHSVLPIWRDAYSMACLNVAKFHYSNSDFREALSVLDMGLIMGGLSLRNDLESAVQIASAKMTALRVSDEATPQCPVELNDAEVLQALPMKSLSCSPVIISDCMAHWPARTKWNDMDYLKRVAGCRTVPVEVVGKKYVRLYPASLSEELYPHKETMLSNSSQDLEFMDCILEEGEMLYIPPKWWHYVRSLTKSFSVSFGGVTVEKFSRNIREMVRMRGPGRFVVRHLSFVFDSRRSSLLVSRRSSSIVSRRSSLMSRSLLVSR